MLVIGAAYLLETLIRGRYHSYSKRHYGQRYRTNLGIDWPYLGQNAREILGQVGSSETLPLLLAGTAGALAAAVLAWRTLRARSTPEPPLLEGALLVLGAWVLAAAHLPLLIVLNHVRFNEYHERYFTPLFLFGAFAGALALALALAWVPGLARVRPRVLAAVGLLCVAGAAGALPARQVSPEYVALRGTAERLTRRLPGVPLLGGYWDTYVWAALQPQGALLPIPREGAYQRTVWWARALPQHPRALVEHSEFPEAGPAEAPAPWLVQYGTLLRLEQPRWDAGAGRTFSLYRNALADALPHTAEPALAEWRPCMPGASLTLSFPPRPRALLLVALSGPPGAVALTAQPLLAEGAAPAPVPLRAQERLHQATLEGGGAPVRGVRLTASTAGAGVDTQKEGDCRAQALFVLDPAGDARP